jgi:uncharacterized membrane protein YkvA (DUF1232 family)
MPRLEQWKQWARRIKRDSFALALACRDSRVSWYAKVTASCVVAYAFSPIDLIPDFIPILGYLDDLILVPLGIALTVRMIPPAVMQECREKADTLPHNKQANWWVAAFIVLLWIVGAALLVRLLWRALLP